ncbi:hypothetical protein KEM52_004658, partial [Ascosphaera acerosa]
PRSTLEEREAAASAPADAEGDGNGDGDGQGSRLVLEFATAYAITKLLLPVRIVASAWATPWFARAVVMPTVRLTRRLLRR